jgi:hypothetical protein
MDKLGVILTFCKNSCLISEYCEKCKVVHKYDGKKKCYCCFKTYECQFYCDLCKHYHDPKTGQCGCGIGSIPKLSPENVYKSKYENKEKTRQVFSHYEERITYGETPIYKNKSIREMRRIPHQDIKYHSENEYGYVNGEYKLIGTKTTPLVSTYTTEEYIDTEKQYIDHYETQKFVEKIPIYKTEKYFDEVKNKVIVGTNDNLKWQWIKLDERCYCDRIIRGNYLECRQHQITLNFYDTL